MRSTITKLLTLYYNLITPRKIIAISSELHTNWYTTLTTTLSHAFFEQFVKKIFLNPILVLIKCIFLLNTLWIGQISIIANIRLKLINLEVLFIRFSTCKYKMH